MALLTGFYYNIARKLANENMDYILISEGNRVNIDPNSILGICDINP